MTNKFIYAYLIIINIIAYLSYGIDKRRAVKNKYRLSEAYLLSLSLLGGFVGSAFGMKHFHHKTKKLYFKAVIIFSILIYVALFYFIDRR